MSILSKDDVQRAAQAVMEIIEMQKLGICRNLNVVENIVNGKHDSSIAAADNLGVADLADYLIAIDSI